MIWDNSSRALFITFLAAACCSMVLVGSPALADAVSFHIPKEDAAKGIADFGKQSGLQIIASKDDLKHLETAPVVGVMDAETALKQLISGLPLTYLYLNSNTITVESNSTTTSLASRAGSPVCAINISAGPLREALEQLQKQCHVSVSYKITLIRGKAVVAVSGSYTVPEALKTILGNTGVVAQVTGPSTFVLRAAQRIHPQSAAASSARSNLAVDATEHVLISGDRLASYDPTQNVDLPRTIDDVQPYYIFDSEAIEESGALNVEDFLKQRLPMDTSSQTNSQSGYGGPQTSGTTSSINLRGLGANETLILVDGHRQAGVELQDNGGQPDINGLPMAAIDRIEILPSSASAIYGGSALGGVINIILKKNYEGGDVKVDYSNAFTASAPTRTVSGTYGFALEGGKTHVMLTAHYSSSDPMLLGDRESLIQAGINTILKSEPSFIYNPTSGWLGATPNIYSVSYNPDGTPQNLVLLNGTPLYCPITYIPAGTSPSTSAANLNSGLLSNACKYNFNPAPGTQTDGLRSPYGYTPTTESIGATVRRQMTSWLEAFTEILITSNAGTTQWNNIDSVTYAAGNPNNPFQQAVVVEFPLATSLPETTRSTTATATVGVTADLPHRWKADVDYTWSQNTFSNSDVNFDFDAFRDPNTGAVFPNPNLNFIVDTIKYPPNLAKYYSPQRYSGSSTVNDLALRGAGPLIQLPLGAPTLAVGLEHRKEGYPDNIYYQTFPISVSEDGGTEFLSKYESDNSVYLEATIPVVSEHNALPGLRLLEFQAADRDDFYSVDTGTDGFNFSPNATPPYNLPGYFPSPPDYLYGSTSSYRSNNKTLGFKYKPIEDVIVRASLATAFLPPTYGQLLPNPTVSTDGATIVDPKNGNSYEVNTVGGGNPNLQPQNSRSYSLGVIYEPVGGPLAGFRADAELYRILQFGYITSPTPQIVVDTPGLADRISRDPTTGLITQINLSLLNATEFKTQGWDLSLSYRLPTSIGSFDLHLQGTAILYEDRQYTQGSTFANYAGWPDTGGEAKGKAGGTLNWNYHQWKLGWTTTWYSKYNQEGAPGDPCCVGTYFTQAQGSNTIPAQVYHDIYASYTIDKGPNVWAGSALAHMIIQGGVKDAFNSSPPFDVSAAPYYVSFYGPILLRSYWLSLKKSL
jgi:outer membrane receptor protein involved in Fe transport